MLCPDCRKRVNSWQETCARCGANLSHAPAKHSEGFQPVWGYYPTRWV